MISESSELRVSVMPSRTTVCWFQEYIDALLYLFISQKMQEVVAGGVIYYTWIYSAGEYNANPFSIIPQSYWRIVSPSVLTIQGFGQEIRTANWPRLNFLVK